MVSLAAGRASVYPVLRDVQSRFGFLLDAKVVLQREMRRLMRKPFEQEFALVEALQGERGDFLDVGANRGQSIDAIKLFYRDAHITAFEPNALLAERIEARFRHDPTVEVVNAGLSDARGEHELYIPFYRKFMYDGLASFDYSEAHDWLNEETVWHFQSENLTVESCTCQLKVMDEFELQPVLVKIDVQGNERSVLAGAEKTLETHKPLIIQENNPEGHIWLTERGWQSYAFSGGRLTPAERGDNNTVYLYPGSRIAQRVLGMFSS